MLNSNQQYDQYQVNNPQQNQSYMNQQQSILNFQDDQLMAKQRFALFASQMVLNNYNRKVEFDYLIVKKYSDKKLVEFVYKSGNKTEHDIQNKITKDKDSQKVNVNINGFNIVVPQYIARLIK